MNVALLEKSIEIVVGRHEALRTRIVVSGGRPWQQVEPTPLQLLSIVDLSDQRPNAHQEASQQAQEFIDTPIELATGPLFEAKIWRLSDTEHVLILLVDHLVSDAISNGIITREVWECYRQGVLGQLEAVRLPPILIQFPDYAVWQDQTRPAWMKRHAEHWKQHLRGACETTIPADQITRDPRPGSGITEHFVFGAELTDALRQAARRERVLLSIYTLAVYATVISGWCGREDLLITFPSHGRHRQDLHNIVGFVANMLLLRIHVNKEQKFSELLAQVKIEVAGAFEHRDFDRLPDFLPEYWTELVFNWQATHSKQGPLDHHVVLECADALSYAFEVGSGAAARESNANSLRVLPFQARSPGGAKFVPVIFDTPSSIQMTITFDPNILEPATIESFVQSFLTVSREACQNSASSIGALLDKVGTGQVRS